METTNPWKTTSSEIAFDNAWIEVRDEKTKGPGNRNFDYGVVHFKNLAVGILPIDEEDNTFLVGQWRYPLGRYSWEIPEGGCLIGQESPLEAAQRELKEEIGVTASDFNPLLEMDLSNSVTDERAIVFLAKNLEIGTNDPEPSEQLQVKKIPFREALDMVLNGQITDAISVAAILKYQLTKSKI